MRTKAFLVIAVAAAAALALALVSVGRAGPSDIYGSDHDVGSAGNPTCEQCHTPHKAQGIYLWAQVPKTGLQESAPSVLAATTARLPA